MKDIRLALVVIVCAAFTPAGVSAATIHYTNSTVDQMGTGFGNILQILTLQQAGGGDTQTGSVLWDGAAAVRTGNATPVSAVISVAQLTAANVTGGSMGLILNVNEPGGQQTFLLQDFELVFQDVAGNELFVAAFDAPVGGLPMAQVGSGQGAAGHLFLVEAFSAQELAFFDNPGNRLGQRTTQPMLDVAGGAENFYIQAVPEPGTATLIGAGLLGLLRRRRAH